MAMEKVQYTRLPGRLRNMFHTASLWLGDDHLLAVNGWSFSEDYKRFYYRDIQAIVVTRAPRFVVPALWVVAILALSFTALFAKIAAASWLANGCLEIMLVLALYLLIVDLAQSCRCRIQTAVSREELPSINRMWTARKALVILERRIAEVQGTLVEGWMASVPESSAPASAVTEKPAPPGSRTSAAELILYASLMLGGAWILYRPMAMLWTVALAVHTLLAVGVLVDNRLRGGARSAVVLAVLVLILAGGVAYADNFIGAMRQEAAHPGQLHLTVRPEFTGQTPLLRQIYGGGCLALAAAGALSLGLRRRG